MFKNTKMLSFLMIAFVLGIALSFQACNQQNADVKEEKKVTVTPTPSETNQTESRTQNSPNVLSPFEIYLNGPTAMLGKGLVEQKDGWEIDFDPSLPVYAACKDAGRGNNFMNNNKRNVWDEYKFFYDSTRMAYVLNQPVPPGKLPLMFNLCQIHNGRLSFLNLASYLESGFVYDNRTGPNNRVVFCGANYQPETKPNGEVIPLAYDENGKPYPNEAVNTTAAGNKTK